MAAGFGFEMADEFEFETIVGSEFGVMVRIGSRTAAGFEFRRIVGFALAMTSGFIYKIAEEPQVFEWI